MKYVFLILLSLIIVAGCQTKGLREDPTPISAKDAGYPSAELRINGTLVNGLSLTSLPLGAKWDDFNLSVQGYYSGSVSVVSYECGIDYSVMYSKNQLVRIPLTGPVERSCVFGITVSFDMPKKPSSSVKVYPIIGWVAVKALEAKDDEWLGLTHKGYFTKWNINSGDKSQVRAFLNGCGNTIDQRIDPKDGIVTIMFPQLPNGVCLMDGVLFSPDYANLYLNTLIVNYDPKYTKLPNPIFDVTKGTLNVTMDAAVSIVSMDNAYEVSNEGHWSFDPTVDHIVRGLTVKGRTIFGIYKKGVWEWIQ